LTTEVNYVIIKEKGVKIMKPIGSNNINAWGYIGLMILFCIPDVGFIAMILLSIFGKGEVRSFSRAFLILTAIGCALIVAAVLLGFGGLDQLVPELLPEEGGVELFRNLPGLLG